MRATLPIHLIYHDLITPITLSKERKLWGSQFYNFLHPSVTFSLRAKYSLQDFALKRPQSMLFF
jgi:hypothetical protein